MGRSNTIASPFAFCLIVSGVLSYSSCGFFSTTNGGSSWNSEQYFALMLKGRLHYYEASPSMYSQNVLPALSGSWRMPRNENPHTWNHGYFGIRQGEAASSVTSYNAITALLTATASMSTARDIFANPRYASQMTAAFTEQHAVHQALEEKRRAVDA